MWSTMQMRSWVYEQPSNATLRQEFVTIIWDLLRSHFFPRRPAKWVHKKESIYFLLGCVDLLKTMHFMDDLYWQLTWLAERGTRSRAPLSSARVASGISNITNIIRVRGILRERWLAGLKTASWITARITGSWTADRARRRGRGWSRKGGLVTDQLVKHRGIVIGCSRHTTASLARGKTKTLASWMTFPRGS